jgi:hypothetical protein
VRNLTQVVQPIGDEHFHIHADCCHHVQEDSSDHNADDDQNPVMLEAEIHDGGCNFLGEEECDSEDFLDQPALKPAQKLGEEVCQAALGMQKLRDSDLRPAQQMLSIADNSDLDDCPTFVIPQELLTPVPTSILALIKCSSFKQFWRGFKSQSRRMLDPCCCRWKWLLSLHPPAPNFTPTGR